MYQTSLSAASPAAYLYTKLHSSNRQSTFDLQCERESNHVTQFIRPLKNRLNLQGALKDIANDYTYHHLLTSYTHP